MCRIFDSRLFVENVDYVVFNNFVKNPKGGRSSNKDEFTSNMTLTVKMTVNGFGGGNSKKAVRIFSLRGCHLSSVAVKPPTSGD